MCLKDKEVAGVVLTSDLCWIMLKALLVIKADWRGGGGRGCKTVKASSCVSRIEPSTCSVLFRPKSLSEDPGFGHGSTVQG